MNRENLLDKIRALLSKTVTAGCTENEALAALNKARAMMDAYEVSESELKVSAEIGAILNTDGSDEKDSHGIKSFLTMAIAEFCDCKAWRDRNKKIVFCGLPSDVELARFLLDSLGVFVQGELANHLATCIAPKGERRFIINGFVAGCANRISQRLRELIAQSRPVASANSTALVVVKTTAIAAKMKELNLNLRTSRSRRRSNADAYAAGRSAGDRASFGRPVGGGHAGLIGR